jgi:hypothetical protein
MAFWHLHYSFSLLVVKAMMQGEARTTGNNMILLRVTMVRFIATKSIKVSFHKEVFCDPNHEYINGFSTFFLNFI